MKSIGIITIHGSQNNYGGVLQCFALYEYLRRSGYRVQVIDLHRPVNKDYIESFHFRPMRSNLGVKSIIKGWLKDLFRIKTANRSWYERKYNTEAYKKFERFNAQVELSDSYSYIPDLYDNPPTYDVYISGSDQLWNPTQPYSLEPYFLTFVKAPNAIKLSYGTSIGINTLHKSEKLKFKRWLSDYDYISVREHQAVNLLNSFLDKKIERVPDPTFLLNPEIWLEMATLPNKNEKYILVFYLGHNNEILKKAREIAGAWGCKVKVIDQNYEYGALPNVEPIVDAGPSDFIGLIKSAQLVLTNSFHCTVFSLISCTRNFYTYIAPDSDRGSRIEDLLAAYNLSDRIVNSFDDIPSPDILQNKTINADHIRRVMAEERAKGQEFLERTLSPTKSVGK